MEVEIRVGWGRVFTMILFVVGVITMLLQAKYVESLMMVLMMYWINMAWFYEGKSKALWMLLREAKELMEKLEPVSMRERDNAQ